MAKLIKSNKFMFSREVNRYTYFGIILAASGSLTDAIATLCSKATKAIFKLRNAIFGTGMAPKTSLYLFDTLIRPISTYGAEIWEAFAKYLPRIFHLDNTNYSNCDDACFEKLDLRFSKSILSMKETPAILTPEGNLVDAQYLYTYQN